MTLHWSDLLNKASTFNTFRLLKAMLCLLAKKQNTKRSRSLEIKAKVIENAFVVKSR